MSSRALQGAEQHVGELRVRKAVARSLDTIADVLPEILSLSDTRVIALEVQLERALIEALKSYHPSPDRSL